MQCVMQIRSDSPVVDLDCISHGWVCIGRRCRQVSAGGFDHGCQGSDGGQGVGGYSRAHCRASPLDGSRLHHDCRLSDVQSSKHPSSFRGLLTKQRGVRPINIDQGGGGRQAMFRACSSVRQRWLQCYCGGELLLVLWLYPVCSDLRVEVLRLLWTTLLNVSRHLASLLRQVLQRLSKLPHLW